MIDRDSIDILARNIEKHAFRRGYVSAFTLAAYPVGSNEELTLHITRECDGLVYGNAEVGTVDAFTACAEALDGRVDYIVYDTNLPFGVPSQAADESKRPVKKSVLLPYSDLHVWLASVRYTLLALVTGLPEKNVLLIGLEKPKDRMKDFLGTLVANLKACCGNVWTHTIDSKTSGKGKNISEFYQDADIVVGAAVYEQVIRKEFLEVCERNPLIVDAGIGTLTPEAAEYARGREWKMIRVDNRAAMAGMLFSAIQSYDLATRVMGEGRIDGIPVVAGGIIGAPGAIVVDSIDGPSMAIGIADGTGRIRYESLDEKEAANLDKVRKAIGGEKSDG